MSDLKIDDVVFFKNVGGRQRGAFKVVGFYDTRLVSVMPVPRGNQITVIRSEIVKLEVVSGGGENQSKRQKIVF